MQFAVGGIAYSKFDNSLIIMWLGKTLDARGPTGHLWTFPRRRSGRVASPFSPKTQTCNGSTIDLRHETPSPASSCNHLRVFPGKACRCLHRNATTYALLREKCVDACISTHHYVPILGGNGSQGCLCDNQSVRWESRRHQAPGRTRDFAPAKS